MQHTQSEGVIRQANITLRRLQQDPFYASLLTTCQETGSIELKRYFTKHKAGRLWLDVIEAKLPLIREAVFSFKPEEASENSVSFLFALTEKILLFLVEQEEALSADHMGATLSVRSSFLTGTEAVSYDLALRIDRLPQSRLAQIREELSALQSADIFCQEREKSETENLAVDMMCLDINEELIELWNQLAQPLSNSEDEELLSVDAEVQQLFFSSMALQYGILKDQLQEERLEKKAEKPDEASLRRLVKDFFSPEEISDAKARKIVTEEVTKALVQIEERYRELEAERSREQAAKRQAKERTRAQKMKKQEKEKLAAAKAKQKEKEKVRAAAQKAKEKERKKIAALKEREREKAKAAAQKAKEKAKAQRKKPLEETLAEEKVPSSAFNAFDTEHSPELKIAAINSEKPQPPVITDRKSWLERLKNRHGQETE